MLSRQQKNAGTKSGILHDSLTGVVNVSEPVEVSTGTWEIHKFLQGKAVWKPRGEKKGLWMTESVVVVWKRVTIVEQRAGRE